MHKPDRKSAGGNEIHFGGADRADAVPRNGGRRTRSLPVRVERRTSARIAEACLEMLPGPVLLVDDSLRLLLANAAARLLLGGGAGLRIAADRIQLADADAQRALASLVASLTSPAGFNGRQRVVLARRTGHVRPLRLAVQAMNVSDSDMDTDAEYVAALFIDDPERRPQPLFETLQELYGVTAAEARLAFALYDGETIDAAAGRFGVSTLTVRTQLKSLFGRMGVHSQSQLVRELGVLAGWATPRSRG